MTDPLRFEPFDKHRHDRARFDCGVPELNDFLKTRLGQQSRKNLTRGYVLATPEGRIAGYVTLSASMLSISILPEAKGLPQRMPLPATLIGRLAVDRGFRGRRLGELLLMHAMRLAVRTSESVGSAVIEVDAKDDAARTFYAKYGFRSLLDDVLHMYLPMETARAAVFPNG